VIRNIFIRILVCCIGLTWLTVGCGRREAPPASSTAEQKTPLRQLIFQSDWFPQAEHGGFYQALAKGYYREAGLDVEILPGGPGAGIKLKIAKGDADLGMMRSDDVALAVSQGLPLLIVGATLQHDAEALLVHADSPVKTLADLAGRTVIAPISMTFIPFIQKRYGIQFNLIPTTYGLAAFLANKDAIQTCFLTSEPFYARQRGVAVRVLPVTDAGYDVYQAIACRQKLAREEPEVVRAFVAASIRGWRDYMENDPTPANRLILERNREHDTRSSWLTRVRRSSTMPWWRDTLSAGRRSASWCWRASRPRSTCCGNSRCWKFRSRRSRSPRRNSCRRRRAKLIHSLTLAASQTVENPLCVAGGFVHEFSSHES
jgi:NitT/TauT family transport system substrate-binding protein